MEHNCGEGAVLEVKGKTGLYPLGAGEEVCKKGHCWGPGVRGHYLIHYVIRGKGSYYCGVNRYELTAGDLFVIYPGTVIQYRGVKLIYGLKTGLGCYYNERLNGGTVLKVTKDGVTDVWHESVPIPADCLKKEDE